MLRLAWICLLCCLCATNGILAQVTDLRPDTSDSQQSNSSSVSEEDLLLDDPWILLSDGGSGSESVSSTTVEIPTSEEGSGQEPVTSTTEQTPTFEDGSGTETLSTTERPSTADEGYGTETVTSSTEGLSTADESSGTEPVTSTTEQTSTFEDGSGTETLSTTERPSTADESSGTETVTSSTEGLSTADESSGTEPVTSTTEQTSTFEDGSGTETLSTTERPSTADESSGTETVTSSTEGLSTADESSGTEPETSTTKQTSTFEDGSGTETLSTTEGLSTTYESTVTKTVTSSTEGLSTADESSGTEPVTSTTEQTSEFEDGSGTETLSTTERPSTADEGSGTETVTCSTEGLSTADESSGTEPVRSTTEQTSTFEDGSGTETLSTTERPSTAGGTKTVTSLTEGLSTADESTGTEPVTTSTEGVPTAKEISGSEPVTTSTEGIFTTERSSGAETVLRTTGELSTTEESFATEPITTSTEGIFTTKETSGSETVLSITKGISTLWESYGTEPVTILEGIYTDGNISGAETISTTERMTTLKAEDDVSSTAKLESTTRSPTVATEAEPITHNSTTEQTSTFEDDSGTETLSTTERPSTAEESSGTEPVTTSIEGIFTTERSSGAETVLRTTGELSTTEESFATEPITTSTEGIFTTKETSGSETVLSITKGISTLWESYGTEPVTILEGIYTDGNIFGAETISTTERMTTLKAEDDVSSTAKLESTTRSPTVATEAGPITHNSTTEQTSTFEDDSGTEILSTTERPSTAEESSGTEPVTTSTEGIFTTERSSGAEAVLSTTEEISTTEESFATEPITTSTEGIFTTKETSASETVLSITKGISTLWESYVTEPVTILEGIYTDGNIFGAETISTTERMTTLKAKGDVASTAKLESTTRSPTVASEAEPITTITSTIPERTSIDINSEGTHVTSTNELLTTTSLTTVSSTITKTENIASSSFAISSAMPPTTDKSLTTITPSTASMSSYKSPTSTVKTEGTFSSISSTSQEITTYIAPSSITTISSSPVVTPSTTTAFSTASSTKITSTATLTTSITSMSVTSSPSTKSTNVTSSSTSTVSSKTTSKPVTTTTTPTTTVPAKNAVAFFDYGPSFGDNQCVRRSVDFTCPVFKPLIGFPFGYQLRQYIYYTDNGLIVFPVSRNNIFSYPIPPQHGLKNAGAVIAVFWDDSDFTFNGTTYYQQYTRSSNAIYKNNDVVQTVESMIRKYTKTSYTAEWTLKITWENAPAYQADNSLTNTYQAVLTTNGYVSYVLMLYKDGGMRWDVTNRINNCAIGYSSGENDGFYMDDELMLKAPAEKYRPYNYVQIDPDLRALRMYPLTKTTLENNRLTCLTWYNSEPSPFSWNFNLMSCPCSYNQGILDFRFARARSDQPNRKVLRSLFPNWFFAGIKCVYGNRNNYLYGFQERVWRLSDADTDYYDVCCNQLSDPRFCSMYMEKRPPIICSNFRPLFFGWMFGDPHITTLDGLTYTFNGLGEFLLLNATNSHISLALYGRTVQTGTAMATNFNAFALQYISSNTSVKVEWYLEGNHAITAYVDGQVVNYTYSNETGLLSSNTNPSVYMLNSTSVTATLEGVLSVSVSAEFGLMNAMTYLPDEFMNKTRGLMGTWNNNQNDEYISPDGTILSNQSTEKEIYENGLKWAVTGSSIFTKQNALAKSSKTFTPSFLSDLKSYGNYSELLDFCQNNTECVFDSLTTNNREIGLLSLNVSTKFNDINGTLNTNPPLIFGNTTLHAFIGEQIQFKYSADTTVNFTTDVSYKDVNVTSDGNLTWIPSSTDGFTLQLIAVDSKNLTSTLVILFYICDCRLPNECDYNELTKVDSSSVYIADCNCADNYTGTFCKTKPDPCIDGCFPGVQCDNITGCGFCPVGFTGDGKHCSDINECATNNSCSPFEVCTNLLMNYSCSCRPGFTDNGTYCIDVNECIENPCSANATCINTEGNYTCICKDGFNGNGTYCADINECLTKPCSSNAICSNTEGSYTCTCNDGFIGNGTVCTCDVCEAHYCNNGGTCTRVGAECTQKCTCHPAFIDDRCIIAGNNFTAKLKAGTEMRTILAILQQSGRNFTASEAYSKVNDFMSVITEYKKASDFLPLQEQGDTFTTNVTAHFAYAANLTTIRFLNNDLLSKIKDQLNKTTRSTSDLRVQSVEEGFKLSEDDLRSSLSCELNGYGGYTLDTDSFTCVSVCNSYCKNNAICWQFLNETLCRCAPFGIYATSGPQCEKLTINMNAFFGILFGALAFLLLLCIGIGIYCFYKKKGEDEDNERLHKTEFSWKRPPLSGFSKLKETTLPTLSTDENAPNLTSWKPHLQNVDSFNEVRIKRPSLIS